MVDFPILPARTALLNVDIQRLFVADAADGLAVVDRINHLAAVCREAGIIVVHTRHVLRPDASDAGVLGELFPEVKSGMLSPDGEYAGFHEDLMVDPRDVLLEKPRFGAFHATGLELLLRSRGIETVILTGIETDICCDTTAREAMQREFRVLFVSDATTTRDKGDLSAAEIQRVVLNTLQAFAQILTTEEIMRKIELRPAATENPNTR